MTVSRGEEKGGQWRKEVDVLSRNRDKGPMENPNWGRIEGGRCGWVRQGKVVVGK